MIATSFDREGKIILRPVDEVREITSFTYHLRLSSWFPLDMELIC